MRFAKHFTFPGVTALGDLRQVSAELLFFDDQEALSVSLYQTEVMKALHEKTDARPRRSDHLGQFFVGNL